ncbi:cytochrome c-type biogenesis protein CcmH [Pseudomonas sp.]|uniref:cytochrome c-type biogenesis protein n=1 Tax=Pseudomonas sp. TaxID=306 RepID=UPI003A973358
MNRFLCGVVLALGFASSVQAASDTYVFNDETEQGRYIELTQELRCPKCQNQNIADSNASIAADLRKEIFRMLGEGQSNQQIIDFMVDRYGEFVRYKPELNRHTWLLWFGPVGFLLGGLLVIRLIVVRHRMRHGDQIDVLTEQKRQQLSHLLEQKYNE